MNDKRMPILKHLDELRRVLIVSLISIIPASALAWFYRDQLLHILTRPVDKLNYKLVYISPTEAFMANIKIAVIGGIILASPIIAWQLWSFVLPALSKEEKKYVFIVMPVSVIMFISGVVFGYFTVFNYGIAFLLGFGGEGLEPMLSLSKYLSFAFWFLLPFGLIFEMPLVIVFLTRLGLVTPQFLAKNRKFALLIIFVISAVVTPTTDMVSQFAMAGPMYLLYEISIWISRFMKVRARKKDLQEEAEDLVPMEEEADEELTEASEETAVEIDSEEEAEKADTAENTEDTKETTQAAIDDDPETKRLEDIYEKIVEKGKDKE